MPSAGTLQPFTLVWKAEAVKSATRLACIKGINSVLADCVLEAMNTARVDSGDMKGSIKLQAAAVKGAMILGAFGSWTIAYTLWQEIGTRNMQGTFFLHRAAASHFQSLPARIARYSK